MTKLYREANEVLHVGCIAQENDSVAANTECALVQWCPEVMTGHEHSPEKAAEDEPICGVTAEANLARLHDEAGECSSLVLQAEHEATVSLGRARFTGAEKLTQGFCVLPEFDFLEEL